MRQLILLVAHGTVEDLDDIPAFLAEIRRGRPASAELIHEMRARYEAVGGSPLNEETGAQARAVEDATGIETRFAMRLWQPRVSEVVSDLSGVDEVILVPLAPFSVSVYEVAARTEISTMVDPPRLRTVAPWGSSEALIEAHVAQIRDACRSCPVETTEIILTAHSLPWVAIRAGDTYEREFHACAEAVAKGLILPSSTAYQSQGTDGGDWLGPTLQACMEHAAQRGRTHIVVAPIGFLSEHVETLYDLDIEARSQAAVLGIELVRVPALSSHPGLIRAIAVEVERVLGG